MRNESRRFYLLIFMVMVWVFAVQIISERMGWNPKPKPKPAAVAEAKPDGAAAEAGAEKGKVADAAPEKPGPELAAPKAERIKEPIVLGSVAKDSGYHLRVAFAQDGAGVELIELTQHEAERVNRDARLPMKLVTTPEGTNPSFILSSISVKVPGEQGEFAWRRLPIAHRLWEVVRDEKGAITRPILNPKEGGEVGQEVSFRTTVGDPAITITKTFRLRKETNGLEMSLAFSSPKDRERIYYRLEGPHGLPIEGEWYTNVFREVFVGLVKSPTETQVETRQASDVAAKPEIFLTLPLKYAGVETQYFAVFFEPTPTPEAQKDRIDDETTGTVVELNAKEKHKSDVSVAMTSREIALAAAKPVEHTFRIFAGPKTTDALAPFGAADLATYRKTAWYFRIPYASTLAQGVISPLLDRIYALTENVSRLFGGQRGNYGIAIILLTITVRMLLFPLSRKQAISAKRMQDLQPKMQELKEKYKDDKEAMTRETWALYKEHKVNPLGGCLLALIQLPIFVGLWQALNNSVRLRHAPFLWIDNLAAPDMLFKFPFELPILGPYFNLLPFAVVGLMLVQMKLFTPPPTTPDQEMSQKMMKYMMVFMSFMFYKVPSGLGIYFITSSTWAICERLLLPKMIKSKPLPEADEPGDRKRRPGEGGGGNGSGPRPGGNGDGNGSEPKPGSFRDRLRQIVEEAQKDRTVRNTDKDRDRDAKGDRGGKPRPKPPGRKR